MKHRDRVLMALNHEEPDRCPMQVSFTPEFASRLKKDLKLTDEDFHNPHGGGNTYVIERALDEDMLLTSVGWANSYYATDTYSEDGQTYTDEWGVIWRNSPYQTKFGPGHYTEMVGHPLAGDDAINSYQPPDPRTKTERGERDWDAIREDIVKRRAEGRVVKKNDILVFKLRNMSREDYYCYVLDIMPKGEITAVFPLS